MVAVGNGAMLMVMVAPVAQVGVAVEVGVKVQTELPTAAVEMVAGDQVPAMLPLVEVRGKEAGAAFSQYGPSCVNVGVVFGCTLIASVACVAQIPAPAVGVKVQLVSTTAPVATLLMAGFHDPENPLLEVVGSAGILAPLQQSGTTGKVGSTLGFTVTIADCPFTLLEQLPTATLVREQVKIPAVTVGAGTVMELAAPVVVTVFEVILVPSLMVQLKV